MATDTILDNEVTLGMGATSKGWWSRKIGTQVPDDSMEVPSQPPTAGYVREKQSQTQSSLQQQSAVEHARHLPQRTELLYYNSEKFPLFLEFPAYTWLCARQRIPEEASITLSISGPMLEKEIKCINNFNSWCDGKCCERGSDNIHWRPRKALWRKMHLSFNMWV